MNDIQKGLLKLLLEIDGICKEHEIEYYLDGGSALGAVRHRGFLPWDDDADIVFTRDNWNKFKEVFRENPLPNRTIEGLDNCPDYTMVYSRYCATDSTCILRTSMLDQFKSGLFIDVFILDPIPDTPENKKEYMDVMHGYAEYLNYLYYDNVIGDNEWYAYFKTLEAEKGKDAVHEFVEKKIFSYPDEEGMTYGFRYDNGSFIYSRELFEKPKYVPFENVYLPIPTGVEEYLRIHYGDNWFMIPQSGEEETHNVVIDLHVPYAEFCDAYMPYIDREKAIDNYKKHHEVCLALRRAKHVVDKNNYLVTAEAIVRLIRLRLLREERSLRQYIEEGDFESVRRILGSYYVSQLNRWFLYQKVYVPLNDDELYAALYLLIADGRFSGADKILALRYEQDAPLSEDLMQIEEMITVIRRVTKAFDAKDYQLALDLSQKMLKNHPGLLQFKESELRARAILAIQNQDANAAAVIREEISQTDKLPFVSDRLQGSELMLAYHFGAEDELDEVANALKLLCENTFNGMLRLEIMDLLDSKRNK